ncbi:MAG TPA: molybdopterin-dependent oxidoreductase [Pirellulales bacterium]|jgi:hypothetical protein|nr:molybdopterin-dependent oxidoreductase [Pirellulales bacterium]
MRRQIAIAVLALFAAAPVLTVAAPTAALRVTNEAGKTTEFSAAELLALPRTKIEVKDPPGQVGQSATYQGVGLSEVLSRAGVTLGKELRGPRLATYLLVEATDGYRVVFALPEVDPASSGQIVLLADRKDDEPLSEKEGPLRIVVPHEKPHSRWVRQVVHMRVLSAPRPAPAQ